MHTSTQPTKRPAKAAKSRKINKITGERFRIARQSCWLTLPQAAKVLQVSERTLHNWESGACRVPFAAYKLMRLMAGGDLGHLCPTWDGWTLERGRLISPEGREFKAGDMGWLSLLVARARLFSELYRKVHHHGSATTAKAAGASAPDASALAALAGRSPDGERSESPSELVSNETKPDRIGGMALQGHFVGCAWGQNGAIMGPHFAGVSHGQAGQVQPETAAGAAPAGHGNRPSHGPEPERLHRDGAAELDGLPSAPARTTASHTQAATVAGTEAHGFATAHAGSSGQGREERSLPLRLRPEVQTLPRRADVAATIGGAP